MTGTEERHGRCLCGDCRFVLYGASNWAGHCACESCRRATASAFTSFVGHPNGAWEWTRGAPANFECSPGQDRGFCATCGTPLYYRSARYPDETHFYAALLDDTRGLEFSQVFFAEEALDWARPPAVPATKDPVTGA
jgi:hypothetical protein